MNELLEHKTAIRVEDYLAKVADNVGNDWMTQFLGISKENMKPMNLWSPADVAEKYHFSYATAYKYMRSGVIPSFQVGNRWYTHGSVLEAIDKRASEIKRSDYLIRQYPRMVFKNDLGDSW